MQFQPTPTQIRSAHAASDPAIPTNGSTPNGREIPYDYVARFVLQGRRGNRVQDVINISVEGTFVAMAIGYSFIPAPLPVRNPNVEPPPVVIESAELSAASLTHPLLPFIEPFVLPANNSDHFAERQAQQLQFIRTFLECSLVKLCGINFKYSIIDSGSGRELQNQPIHNLAGLGESSGDRPFRPFAKPMLFMPRSTIRIEIEEISEGLIYAGAELFIVLHGYKSLNYGA